jgi:hypothetical protein
MRTWRATHRGTCKGCGQDYRADPGRCVDLIASIDDVVFGHYRCACHELDIRFRANGVTPL